MMLVAAVRQLLERRGDKVLFSDWITQVLGTKSKRRLLAVGQYHIVVIKRQGARFVVRVRKPPNQLLELI
jgi:hypothetical protein